MKRHRDHRKLLVVFLIIGFPMFAYAQDPSGGEKEVRTHEDYFAEGMRKYAESQYDEALDDLYRAFALSPSPILMSLIIRTHDFMGQCSAAQNQSKMFTELFPKKTIPSPQICTKTGTIALVCNGNEKIMLGNGIALTCGAHTLIPPGDVIVSNRATRFHQVVSVGANERKLITLPNSGLTIKRLTEKSADEKFNVFQTRDGLYAISVRSDLRDDPELNANSNVPGFTIRRGSSGLFEIKSDRLRPIKSPDKSTRPKK